MSTFWLAYYDRRSAEVEVAVRAPDEAAALGAVLDELGAHILGDSPFAAIRGGLAG
jgi:hypothetical protein